ARDHRAGVADPGGHVQTDRSAVQGRRAHAQAAAAAEGVEGTLRRRQAEIPAGNDGTVQEGEDQPDGGLRSEPDHPADPVRAEHAGIAVLDAHAGHGPDPGQGDESPAGTVRGALLLLPRGSYALLRRAPSVHVGPAVVHHPQDRPGRRARAGLIALTRAWSTQPKPSLPWRPLQVVAGSVWCGSPATRRVPSR